MAGGGGTRLRPLSTAARPKPFLPLLPSGETLLQRTIARLPRAGARSRRRGHRASSRRRRMRRSSGSRRRASRWSRSRRAATPPRRSRWRPWPWIATPTTSWSCCRPTTASTRRARASSAASSGRRGRPRDRRVRRRIAAGDAGHPSPRTRPPSTATWCPREAAGRGRGRPARVPAGGLPREAGARRRPRRWSRSPGVAWNAGMFLWRRRAIRAALERHAPDVIGGVAAGLAAGDLAAAYAAAAARVSIDYAVMEPAGAAGEVVMAGLDVGWSDIGTWPALLDVLGAAGIEGRVVEAGMAVAATAADLVVERGPDRARRPRRGGRYDRPPRSHRAPARGPCRTTDRAGPAGSVCSSGGPCVTNLAEAPTPTRIVFGTDGWRARVADEFTFENVRRCADGVARYVVGPGRAGEGRGPRVRPPVRVGALRPGGGRGPPGPRHPGGDQPDRRAHPDELLRGRPARGGRGRRDHRLAQPVDRQRVQGQGADGRGGRGGDPLGRRGGARRQRRDARSSAARSRTPRPPGLVEWYDPFDGYEQFVRRTIDLDALRAADVSILVEPLYGAGSGWIPRLLAGGRIRVTEIHNERNPFFGGVNPEPIRPHVDEALVDPGRRRLRPGPAAGRRRRPRRRGRRATARSSTSWRSRACSCTTWPSTAGCASRSSSP